MVFSMGWFLVFRLISQKEIEDEKNDNHLHGHADITQTEAFHGSDGWKPTVGVHLGSWDPVATGSSQIHGLANRGLTAQLPNPWRSRWGNKTKRCLILAEELLIARAITVNVPRGITLGVPAGTCWRFVVHSGSGVFMSSVTTVRAISGKRTHTSCLVSDFHVIHLIYL